MNKTYTHTVDAKMAKNVGEGSVSDLIQAILELVKNCFDGDATEVTVSLDGVASKKLSKDEMKRLQNDGKIRVDSEGSLPDFLLLDKITVRDNGIAMTDDEIRTKYFRLGTPDRVINPSSRKLGRKVTGARGMGHFSAKSLGNVCTIISNPEDFDGTRQDGDKTITVKINWNKFHDGEDLTKIESVGMTESRVSGIKNCKDCDGYHGFTVQITDLHDPIWNIQKVKKLEQALAMLRTPKEFAETKKDNTFDISIKFPDGITEYAGFEKIQQTTQKIQIDSTALDQALLKSKSSISSDGKLIRTHIYKKVKDNLGNYTWMQEDTIETSLDAPLICGKASFEIWHFPQSTDWKQEQFAIISRQFVQDFLKGPKGDFASTEGMSGVKIFKDGTRVMPYGERSHPTLYDWAGLDKRLLQKGGGKIRQDTIVGVVKLTSDNNPGIKEVATRQGIIQNDEFASVVEFLGYGIEHLEEYKKKIKPGKGTTQKNYLEITKSGIGDLRRVMSRVPMDDGNRSMLNDMVSRVEKFVDDNAKDAEEEKEDLIGSLDMYRPLSTLGLTSLGFGHETKENLSGTMNSLILLERTIPAEDTKLQEIVGRALRQMELVSDSVELMNVFADALSTAKNPRKKQVEIDLRVLLSSLNSNLKHMAKVKDTEIEISHSVHGSANKIFANEAAILSVFTNLISNSIKSLKVINRTKKPSISITANIEGGLKTGFLVVRVRDNGKGIADSNRERIWKPFFSTYKKSSDLRGMGLGLVIVKEIIEDQYRGEIKLEKTTYEEDKPGKGSAEFQIKIPMKELADPNA